ncbi:hypothetical protein NXC12_PD00109 (plasmid) [Rhizobium etli]|uniref:Uncharacterized protein n=1 Tax=Rhizobium etli TaxID=29449 RepID=A0AAN1EMQ1_RHIET|nr:hypothetical protein NXC12_PD00109 [Rhizobium etli]
MMSSREAALDPPGFQATPNPMAIRQILRPFRHEAFAETAETSEDVTAAPSDIVRQIMLLELFSTSPQACPAENSELRQRIGS